MNSCTNDKKVKELFELLAETSSSLAKRDILIENKDNELFTKYINYLLNPFLVTGISEKKISKETEKPSTRTFDSFKELMECGSLVHAREKGLVRSEGKEYVMQDGDVVLFKFNV